MDRTVKVTVPVFKGMLVEPDGTHAAAVGSQHIRLEIITQHANGAREKSQINLDGSIEFQGWLLYPIFLKQ